MFRNPGILPLALWATLNLAPPAQAEQFLADDLVVDGSACIGAGCASGETFGETDLRLKQAAISIVLEDTSTAAGLPTTDWEIKANDIGSNGAEFFVIRNLDANTAPFRIWGDAPNNALAIDSIPRNDDIVDTGIGIGTRLPQTNLHVVSSVLPIIRLERDGSGGFTPSQWNIEASSFEFNVRREDLGGRRPLRILGAAPENSLYIGSIGDVGLGTNAPAAPLHVTRADGSASVLVEDTGGAGAQEMFAMRNNGGSYFTMDNTAAGTTWFFTHENASPNRFIIADAVTDGPELTLTADGDLTIPGQLFTAGSCAAGCDRVFDADYPLPTIAEQAALMREKKHLPAVGPTPEDGPFNITAMTGGMLNELEKAHLYIAQLEDRDRMRAAQIAALEARLSALERR
ncbi:hypothetical protein DU478_20580 [Thalassococcus profundi]|uniref:DUF1521 domain-containing protein n=1 Tax=Thalassococcus profundi TaxID=2282382 RepID=A0A369TJ24_9RHOB|nr:hypothetical protein [Thalassococcus profundi]RDD64395.1 hypothetical protein DU478_20580 [Thalassococcus profundi]